MTWSSPQKYLAEFVGTFALLLFGGGSAVFSLVYVSGFGGDYMSRAILVSLSFGFVLAALAYIFGEISGGHFNPAVTLSMAVSRRMPMGDVVPYLVAQIVGGIVGIGVVAGIAHGSDLGWAAAQHSSLGSQGFATDASSGYTVGAVFLLELALTFVFILVIQMITRPANGAKNLAPLGIGLTLLITNLVAIPVDGASLNPVRSFSPALVSWATWGQTTALNQSWVFWVAPILGGILAAIVEMMFRPKP
jgi:aquaporin Z